MTEGTLLGVLTGYFAPVLLILGFLLKITWSMNKKLGQLNGTVTKHDKVYKACPFCPEKEG